MERLPFRTLAPTKCGGEVNIEAMRKWISWFTGIYVEMGKETLNKEGE